MFCRGGAGGADAVYEGTEVVWTRGGGADALNMHTMVSLDDGFGEDGTNSQDLCLRSQAGRS